MRNYSSFSTSAKEVDEVLGDVFGCFYRVVLRRISVPSNDIFTLTANADVLDDKIDSFIAMSELTHCRLSRIGHQPLHGSCGGFC